ncbi:MAG: hypothetical protein WC356_06215 [Candidatus Micrarchaeia archaeon]|jgi:hypothetical protein
MVKLGLCGEGSESDHTPAGKPFEGKGKSTKGIIIMRHYVEFFEPGSFFPEKEIREVKERDPTKIKVPFTVYGFRFFDRKEIVDEDGEYLFGSPKNYSKMFYFGRTMTLEQVKAEVPNEKILIMNMELNNWKLVVKTRMGNFQPFNKGDQIIGG